MAAPAGGRDVRVLRAFRSSSPAPTVNISSYCVQAIPVVGSTTTTLPAEKSVFDAVIIMAAFT
jgi:hypothetical protein